MSDQERGRRGADGERGTGRSGGGGAPGKTTRTAQLPVQRKPVAPDAGEPAGHEPLPFLDVQLQAERGDAPAEAGGGPGGFALFSSPRFQGDPVLDEVHMGTRTLKAGDTGPPVTRVQAALTDAGHATDVDGTFDADTAKATTAFQMAEFSAGNGVVDLPTIWALDDLFADHTRDAALARAMKPARAPKRGKETPYGKAPKELLAGTQKLDAAERAEASALLAPVDEVDATTGKAPDFQDDVGQGRYVDRLRAVVNAAIDVQYQALAAGKAEAHADPSKLHDMKDIVALAQPAQRATDAVFGSYAMGRAIAPDRVRDRWAEEDKRIRGLEAQQSAGGIGGEAAAASLAKTATWRVQKILNESADVISLNAEHGALGTRQPEAAYIDQVRQAIAGERQQELLEIQRGWEGAADPAAKLIYVQLFKSEADAENRAFMWRELQTMIHEYLHTLSHRRFRTHADNHPDPAKGHALREGMTDYLTKVVWATVNTGDAALRASVEGPFHDATAPLVVPELSTYGAAIEAEQVVGLVGARNAYAAYFLGHVELIGGA